MVAIKLTDSEFEAFEETIASSAKGRAFLREHARRQRIMSTDDVKQLVYNLRDQFEGHSEESESKSRLHALRGELQDMAASIVETKRQIAALQPTDAGQNRIMVATGELDAIVSATERATSEIIAQAELLLSMSEEISAHDPGLAGRVEGSATEILMACSFQDITGQRTNKVVNAMRYLEHRINAMVSIWGVTDLTADGAPGPSRDLEPPTDMRPDAHLLHGPAAEGEGVEQSDIDALFDEPTDEREAEIEMLAPTPAPAPAKTPAPVAAAPAPKKPEPPPKPVEPPVAAGAAMAQDDIDSLFD
jgi:hypothetical protein